MTHNLRADTITIKGNGGDEIEAYLAVPTDVEQCGSSGYFSLAEISCFTRLAAKS